MAATKNFVNSFKGQLEQALKAASINAAVNLIRSNPELTLEDFYTIMRPQGVTETITVGELASVLSGPSGGMPARPAPIISVSPSAATRPTRTPQSPPPVAQTKPKGPRSPSRPPKVNCLTEAGRNEYLHRILECMATTKDWMRNNEIRPFCGGETHQFTPFMRNYLVDAGLVRTRGVGPGKQYRITGKGLKKVGKFPKVADKLSSHQSGALVSGKKNALTLTGEHQIHQGILSFLSKHKGLVTGPQIMKGIGITKSQLRTAMAKNLIPKRLVKATGNTFGRRYIITTKGWMNIGKSYDEPMLQVTARTAAGKEFLEKAVLKFLHGNKWRSIGEIADSVGANKNQVKRMLGNMLKSKLVEHNGGSTNAARYRLARK